MTRLRRSLPSVDAVALGLNATDTLIELPHFPAVNSKVELSSVRIMAGGQAASAMVACRRWGLRTRYIGSVGRDPAGRFQAAELHNSGVDTRLFRVRYCSSQIAYILVDRVSGERTILWRRDPRLALDPRRLKREWLSQARVLLVDGHDTAAAIKAARWAREKGIAVVADLDNVYPGVEVLLEVVDYLFTSQEFPARLIHNSNPFDALPKLSRRFGCRVAGTTFGRLGALAWDGRRFHYSRGFRVRAVDTTGAGDIFHAGIVYGVFKNWPLGRMLEFSCAAAALNCTALGARGGIKSLPEIRHLIRTGPRSRPAFSQSELARAARTCWG